MASVPLEIPTIPSAQKFSISLNNVTYQVRIYWCQPHGCWVMDVADADAVPLRSGAPLVTGLDIMEQFAYLGLGGQLIVQSDTDANAVPTYENLGSIGHLYYLPDELP